MENHHEIPIFNHHFSAPWISLVTKPPYFDGEIGWSSHPFTDFVPFVPVSWDHLDHERHAQDQLLPSVAGGGDPGDPKGTTKVHPVVKRSHVADG